MKKVYIPAFSRNVVAVAHGGVRRTDQIRRLCRFDLEFQWRRWSECLRQRPLGTLVEFLLGFSFAMTLRGNLARAIYLADFKAFLRQHKVDFQSAEFVAELSPGAPFFIAQLLVRKKARFSVCCHNIEFLVANQNRGEFRARSEVAAEIAIYQAAAKAITISTEDSFVVAAFCPEVIKLPYFPSESSVGRFAELRLARQQQPSTERFYLCLGATSNAPTEAGILNVIREFSGLAPGVAKVAVAGFGTEKFKGLEGPNVRICGSVSDAELNELFRTAHAAILYQPPTSGFLTKIVELNLSGLPVFINRSYFPARNLEEFGIFTYNRIVDAIGVELQPLSAFRIFEECSDVDFWPS